MLNPFWYYKKNLQIKEELKLCYFQYTVFNKLFGGNAFLLNSYFSK